MNSLQFEIKGMTEQGTFEGILSPYGNVDQGGDVVEQGAFTKTIMEQGTTRPLLWQHKADTPIGLLELFDSPEGLRVKGSLLMDLPEAKKVYLLVKAKIVRGLSIGFKTIKDEVQNGIRRLKELALFEGSIVTFPMNLAAMITSVKQNGGESKGDFNEELLEIQLRDSSYQMESALCRSLHSLMWSGMSKEDMLLAAQATIEQFGNAYLAFLPNFIDMMMAEHGPMETWASKRELETKAGRSISAANMAKIRSAMAAHQSGMDILSALVNSEAGADEETTSKSQAAPQEAKSEPVPDHSAITPLLTELKGTFQWNH